MLNTRILAALACLAAPTLALAADPNGWSGEAGLGYLASNGNTKTSSMNAKFALNYVEDQWKNAFQATAFTASNEGASTGERYSASDELHYSFTEHDYVFGNAEYDKDLFGPIGERTVETAGYGRHVLTGPVHTLDLEIGAGARQAITNDTDQREDDAIVRLGGKYAWKISATSAFSQSLKIESGSTDTYTESVTELKFNVVGNIFASASYTLRNNTKVPPGIGRTDTFTALNLSYTFGVKK
jgi:putative salt-induced outer membrane protein